MDSDPPFHNQAIRRRNWSNAAEHDINNNDNKENDQRLATTTHSEPEFTKKTNKASIPYQIRPIPSPNTSPSTNPPQTPLSTSILTKLDHWRTLASYVIKDTRQDKSHFFIGIGSIFLVVITIALFATIIKIAPVIFLTRAEGQVGELDLVISPRDGSKSINYTLVREILKQKPARYQYSTPRYSNLEIPVWKASECRFWEEGLDGDTLRNFMYFGSSTPNPTTSCIQGASECLSSQCFSEELRPETHIIDFEREKELDIGRGWSLPLPSAPGLLYINTPLATLLDVTVGDKVIISLSAELFDQVFSNLISEFFDSWNPNATAILSSLTDINVVLTIAGIYPESGVNKFGKSSSGAPTQMILDYASLLETISEGLHPLFTQQFRDYMSQASQSRRLDEQTQRVVFSSCIPRYKCYLETEYKVLAKDLLSWGSDVIFQLGYLQLQGSLPIVESLKSTQLFSRGMGLIFTIVVVLLGALSAFVLHGLLTVSVETKTFELGIWRMIGLTRTGVLELIVIQSLTYAIPGWILGLTLGQILYIFLGKQLFGGDNLDIDIILTPESILYATAMGLLIPILAAIGPVQQALSGNLRDSLDHRHGKVKAIIINIERSGSTGHWDQFTKGVLLIGSLLTIFGFSIYYFLPLALVTNNLSLLFTIFFALIIGMLFGLVLLSVNIQPLIERGILLSVQKVILQWFETEAMIKLVIKNMLAHKLRNRKTSVMLSFALAFVVFLRVNLEVELRGLDWEIRQDYGTAIYLVTDGSDNKGRPYTLPQLSYIESMLESYYPHVLDYAYLSHDLYMMINNIERTAFTNLGKTQEYNQLLIAASPNFLELITPDSDNNGVAKDIISVLESDPVLNEYFPSLSEQLYSVKGSRSTIMSGYLKRGLGLENPTGIDIPWITTFLSSVKYTTFPFAKYVYDKLSPLAFVSNLPVVSTTKYPARGYRVSLVSFTQFVELSNGLIRSVADVPIKFMHISLDPMTPNSIRKKLITELRSLYLGTPVSVKLMETELSSVSSTRVLLDVIFQVATVLVMLLTWFSLNGAMYTNIREQVKEIGILRALGVRVGHLYRVYIYEAFFVTIAAGCIGIGIGMVIGWSMAAQRSVLTEIPIRLPLPWDLVVIMVVAAALSSVLATAKPMRDVLRKGITAALRS